MSLIYIIQQYFIVSRKFTDAGEVVQGCTVYESKDEMTSLIINST